jgi:steroid delta-isomerase-like uncharacterized protein
MTIPHPTDAGFATAYGEAWTSDPVRLLDFFTSDGTYTDVTMNTTYAGREEIGRFHRWMLKFAPDSVIDFSDACANDGQVYLQWIWSGTFHGALRLADGKTLEPTGRPFSVPGVAACRYGTDGKLLSHRDYWDLATVLRQVEGP